MVDTTLIAFYYASYYIVGGINGLQEIFEAVRGNGNANR
jgi:hypothetical protein